MEVLFDLKVLRILLLVVLFAPVVFGALIALTRDNYRAARRMAGLFGSIHLGLTVLLIVPALGYLEHNKTKGDLYFHPIVVPGDSEKYSRGDTSTSTTWNFFSLGATDGAPSATVQFFVGLDGINIWLVVLTSLLTYLAVLVSFASTKEKAGGYYGWIFALQTCITGAFLSFDVILFYAFFELTLIPAFFLIGGWGVGGAKRDAARKFFLYTLLGSLFTLIGIVGIAMTNPASASIEVLDKSSSRPITELPRGPVSFNVNRLMNFVFERTIAHENWVKRAEQDVAEKAWEKNIDGKRRDWKQSDYETLLTSAKAALANHRTAQFWFFFALIAGFVVKVPLVPFHTWLPSAYGESPLGVTLLLSGLMAKLGTLGMLRFVIPLCPEMSVQYGLPVIGTLGAIGIVYAAFCAYAQKDIKLMAAYSSVSHLGLLVLGMFALNLEGLTGSVLHMVNHGLTAGALFALLAFLSDRYKTTDMTRFGGLMAKFPRYSFLMIFICLAGVGMPFLNNFVSEMMLIGGTFTPGNTGLVGYGLAVAAAAGIFLSAWYTFTMIRTVFFGPLKTPAIEGGIEPKDVSGREMVAFGLPAILCLALGLYPQPVIDIIKADTNVIESHMLIARQRINPGLFASELPDEKKREAEIPLPGGPPQPLR